MGRWVATGLVAGALALLALFAAPARAVPPAASGGSPAIRVAVTQGGGAPDGRSASRRPLKGTAVEATSRDGGPPAIPAVTGLVAICLVLLRTLRPLAGRAHGRATAALPAVRAPPLPATR
jgi:hypothetical protein